MDDYLKIRLCAHQFRELMQTARRDKIRHYPVRKIPGDRYELLIENHPSVVFFLLATPFDETCLTPKIL